MSRSRDLGSDASPRASGSARDALVVKFTKALPGWLRRYGVQQAHLADAVQEALVAALEKVREGNDGVPLDDAGVRHELMRIVSTVAQRTRRHAQRVSDRYTSLEDGDAGDQCALHDGRDEEEWLESRVLVLEALENLDEPTRALIFAHEIEGRTNVEIAADLQIKEDAVEKRVIFARQRLRNEVEHLERGRVRRHRHDRHDGMLSLGLGLDAFDRAAFGAFYEATGKTPKLSPWAKLQKFVRSNLPNLPSLPMTAFVGALAIAPNSSPTDEMTNRQEKHISFVDLPEIDISSAHAVPITFLVQGCASRPLAEVAEPESTRSKPETIEAPKKEFKCIEQPGIRHYAHCSDGTQCRIDCKGDYIYGCKCP